jgi:hypothetical protein
MNQHGHINLAQFEKWYLDCDFVTHPEPYTGFVPIYEIDRERYNGLVELAIARDIPSVVTDYLEQNFDHLSDKVYAMHRMRPGRLLPWHHDAYKTYAQRRGVEDLALITRVILFPEDWCFGQVLQIGTESMSAWQCGDWVSWQGTTPHLAANLGQQDRYTLQITGITNVKSS